MNTLQHAKVLNAYLSRLTPEALDEICKTQKAAWHASLNLGASSQNETQKDAEKSIQSALEPLIDHDKEIIHRLMVKELASTVCKGCDGEGEVHTGSSVPGDEGFETCLVCDGKKTQPTNEEIIELRQALNENYYDAKGLSESAIPELEERIRFLTGIITKAPHSTECPMSSSEGECTCWKNDVREMATTTRDTSTCPECNSSDITGMEVVIDNSEAIQELYCNECECEWTDVYTFSSIRI